MIPALLQSYISRPATMDDLPETVVLINRVYRDLMGVEGMYSSGDIGNEWLTPGFNQATDTQIVLAPNGKIVGYYEFWDLQGPHVRFDCWGCIHPDYMDLGIGTYLLSWVDQRAAQSVAKAPQGTRVILRSFDLSINQPVGDLLQKTGYQLIRHNLRMVTELNGQPPVPQWPDGITVRTMQTGHDESTVLRAIRDSFIDHWGHVETPFEQELERWLHRIRTDETFDPGLWFLAMDAKHFAPGFIPGEPGDEIAGISLCRAKTYDDPDMGWVSTLGVRRPWRKRGLGLALLQHSFHALYQRGFRKIGLGVDAQNLTGATRLYEKAGMYSDPNRQYSIYEKELRPGKDLTTQELKS